MTLAGLSSETDLDRIGGLGHSQRFPYCRKPLRDLVEPRRIYAGWQLKKL
jgi:hypothetical protein